ncbi:MAG: ABC transporter ATP-binding protein [Deltaproteobacteria bacterium]|nr:ABC transporter ATP-binding protein [Deltaproteobacteria bacterium]
MLKVENLNSYYGKSHILFDVSFDIQTSEIVSLLGRNGVGKSTTLKTIIGEIDPAGSISFKGESIAGLKPYEIVHKGLGYVPENRDIFSNLTVEQNLMMGIKTGKKLSRWTMDDMFEVFPILEKRAGVCAGKLSGGEQQMLTLCRSLLGDPDLIMIDEPTEGLAPKVISLLARMLEEIKARGVSILLVEQKLAIALKISQRLLVMGHGNIVFEGTAEDFRANASVRKEWLEV